MRYLPLLSVLFGCDVLQEKLEDIEDITNGFVAGGIYLGVEDMNSPFFDISETEFGDNANLTLYLASADISNELSANPISRADVFFSAGSMEDLPILESGEPGAYVATSENGLLYAEGEVATLDITHAQVPHQLSISVPLAPEYSLPSNHTLGTNITIDLTGQEFYETIIVVIRADTGEITYEKRPTDVESLYEFAHPGGITLSEDIEYVTTVDIPAQAFPNNNIYIVSIAGIRSSGPSEMIDVNPLLSSFISGKFNIEEFCVPSCEELSQIPQ
ncbi:MAG: hypothetical protein CL916_14385 [Deltaproteobacteria bacterium]|nr:hypothetical protein [Deltaproteobacteria bacterium]